MIAEHDPLLTRLLAADENVDATAVRILDAALAQFRDFGLRRTSMDDIARAAKLARSSLYRYFENKNTLLEAVVLRELRRFLAEFTTAIGSVTTIEDVAAEGFLVTVRFARTSPLLGGLLFTEPDLMLPYLTIHGGPVLRASRTFLAAQLRLAQETGAMPPHDAEETAETLVRLALSFVLTRDSCVPLDDEEAVRGYARRQLAPIVTHAALD